MPTYMSVQHRRRSMLCPHRRQQRRRIVPDPPGYRKMVRVPDAATVSTLVQASAKGDEAAWNELVRRYAPLVLAVTRSYQLARADIQDVSQTLWLRLVEHRAGLREPEALPGWLVTTGRREWGRRRQRGGKMLPGGPQATNGKG